MDYPVALYRCINNEDGYETTLEIDRLYYLRVSPDWDNTVDVYEDLDDYLSNESIINCFASRFTPNIFTKDGDVWTTP